ncbi:hypothetical protein RRF57_005558 [Xylaria bambusicola]|uniref:Uncharacterized protein n=1 Tax=Xylaria bambusicola TaxID=326684 RepID=A0AAN7UMF5_9PEZI
MPYTVRSVGIWTPQASPPRSGSPTIVSISIRFPFSISWHILGLNALSVGSTRIALSGTSSGSCTPFARAAAMISNMMGWIRSSIMCLLIRIRAVSMRNTAETGLYDALYTSLRQRANFTSASNDTSSLPAALYAAMYRRAASSAMPGATSGL